MENLSIKIGDNEYLASFDKDDFNTIHLNDKVYKIELLKKYDNNIFSFSVNQKLMQVELEFSDEDNLLISYDGFSYEIHISSETKKLLEKFILISSSSLSNSSNKIKAPMPGMVVKLLVQEGQEVKKGDQLIIVEAMKMENALKANFPGLVKSIKVKEGQAVEKDALLIEIEPFKI